MKTFTKEKFLKAGRQFLPSKRARKAPEKIQVSKDDLAELSETATPEVESPSSDETSEENISLEEVSEAEDQVSEQSTETTDENI